MGLVPQCPSSYLVTIVAEREHVPAEGCLQLRLLEEVVLHHLRIRVSLELYHYPHTVAIAFCFFVFLFLQ